MRLGIVDGDAARRASLLAADREAPTPGATAIAIEAAATRRPAYVASAEFDLDGALVAAASLGAVGSGLLEAVPWCVLDDGTPIAPALLRGGFAGVVPAPGPEAPPDAWARCVIGARRLLVRRLEVDARSIAVEMAAAGVIGADRRGRVRFVNGAYVRFLDGAPADPVGRPLSELLVPVGDEASIAGFQRALHGAGPWSGEVRLEGAAATTVFAASVAPIAHEHESRRGFVATLHDLSARCAIEESLRAAHRLLERRAWSDPLTGLANRAFFDDALEREMARTRRHGTPTSVLLVDLDDFKRVNDVHGHDAGDEVLAAVSGALRLGLREGDVLARYGGDEFCVLLAATEAATAAAVAERVRVSVAALRTGAVGEIVITTSIGLATSADIDEGAGAHALVGIADRAMYDAKRTGGNRVRTAGAAAPGAASPTEAVAAPRAEERAGDEAKPGRRPAKGRRRSPGA